MTWPSIPALVAMGGLATAGSGAVRAMWQPAAGNWRWWHSAAALAGITNLGLLGWRAVEAGPDLLRHSFDITGLLATLVLATGFACVAAPRLRGLDAFLIPLAAVIQAAACVALLWGAEAGTGRAPAWFVVHMLTLAAGAACFAVGGTAGLVYVATNRILRQKRPSPLLGRVPSLESLERFCRWMMTVGLPFFTFGILTGICEMVQSDQPSAWLRDPVVLLSSGLWMAYATMVVAIWLRPRNRGRRAAVLAACGVIVVLIVFLVLGLIPAAH